MAVFVGSCAVFEALFIAFASHSVLKLYCILINSQTMCVCAMELCLKCTQRRLDIIDNAINVREARIKMYEQCVVVGAFEIRVIKNVTMEKNGR